ncbi:hypothetical protein [Pontiella agarivorans]|uniref:Response regulatory domain-containing protein n=1 Tax=Pontiella agarivorans TaxID=3038953 RepID=A0ABU5MY55_9BACT|nr:hypothetical protein [Pontiella agarivorans]MDZ8119138.1 hypothetical protein [Pontiella agarivorans]
MKREIRVVIAGGNRFLRVGLREAVEHAVGLKVAGEVSGGSEELDDVGRLNPDIVLMEYGMFEKNGIGNQSAPVLIYSLEANELESEKAVEGGAFGYIPSLENVQQVVESVLGAAPAAEFISVKQD